MRNWQVYYLRDAAGVYLYIGMSSYYVRRVRSHRRKSWGRDIAEVTASANMSHEDAVRLERDEIVKHQPIHNVAVKNGLEPYQMASARSLEARRLASRNT